ncbi:homeobox protein BEL1 homolog [Cucurbita pepo subsp. pepo]|uniref:homeobox protein BEL1 homolog n=1 Tax=Cucurbita pepo subsp. pepo TaxID=3664 RepID=UPI000C9D3EB7|nr:homeobox protein BEL1 homolog [Cucurbita pepo subsp. pepo]XP_023551191.1 homeobox protein BEL1 homolog [Cucurbita pepo subsp. pepo]
MAGEDKSNEMVVGGFYYNSNQIQPGFGSSTEPAEMFNLQVNNESGGGGDDEFHHHLMVVGPWGTAAAADSSLRCVFPCEANERPSHGLSLSLSSTNPSSIGLQSFELRTQQSSLAIFQLRNSKFLAPTQELLYEFCSLEITNDMNNRHQNQAISSTNSSLQSLDFMELQKRKTKLFSLLEEVERRYRHYCEQMKAVVASFEAVAGNGAARVYSALASKAMSKHFRSLKDGIVGQIQATKKAMGEKDPIAPGTTRGETPRLRVIDQALRQQRAFHQISVMESHPWRPQRGLPERSVSVLRAWLFEHFLHPYPSDVDKHILSRQTGLSRSQVSNWFINARVRLWKPMVEEMYLEETKEQVEEIDNTNFNNMNNNGNNSFDGMMDFDDEIDGQRSIPTGVEDRKPTSDQLLRIDSEGLSSIISNNSEKNDSRAMKAMQNHQGQHVHNNHNHTFGRIATDAFGMVELDFSSYNHDSCGVSSYLNNNNQHFNNGSSSSVSLTLGLQQHAAGGKNVSEGVSIAFSPVTSAATATQSSIFFTRDHIEECQPVQYSLLDGETTQNLPYRNLMGAQLLHDLAG